MIKLKTWQKYNENISMGDPMTGNLMELEVIILETRIKNGSFR